MLIVARMVNTFSNPNHLPFGICSCHHLPSLVYLSSLLQGVLASILFHQGVAYSSASLFEVKAIASAHGPRSHGRGGIS